MQGCFQFDDTDRAIALDAEIEAVLCGRSGPWPITDEQRMVLRALREAKGAQRAVPIRELIARTGLDERTIKQVKHSLMVEFRLPIAGSRQTPVGYYFPLSAEERIQAARPLKHEIQALALCVRVLESPQALRELLGQIQAELNKRPETLA